jgi:predicted Na+-dependent transporter
MDLALLTALLVRVFLVVTMLSIGLRLADDGVSGRRITRSVALRILLANLIVVPVVAVAVTAWSGIAGAVAVAILATAIAPAGSLGPKLVQFARGDLAVGVLATFLLSILAVVTVAPSLELAGRLIGLDPQASPLDPIVLILTLAVFQLGPTLVGLLIASRAPALGRRIVQPLTALSTSLVVVLVIVALVDTYDEVLVLGVVPVVAMTVIVVAASSVGWLAGGTDPAVRRASSLVTGQRAPGLALLVVAGPGHATETAAVVTFALILFVVNGAAALLYGRPWTRLLDERRARQAAA